MLSSTSKGPVGATDDLLSSAAGILDQKQLYIGGSDFDECTRLVLDSEFIYQHPSLDAWYLVTVVYTFTGKQPQTLNRKKEECYTIGETKSVV